VTIGLRFAGRCCRYDSLHYLTTERTPMPRPKGGDNSSDGSGHTAVLPRPHTRFTNWGSRLYNHGFGTDCFACGVSAFWLRRRLQHVRARERKRDNVDGILYSHGGRAPWASLQVSPVIAYCPLSVWTRSQLAGSCAGKSAPPLLAQGLRP
jgi:hypothetical protein